MRLLNCLLVALLASAILGCGGSGASGAKERAKAAEAARVARRAAERRWRTSFREWSLSMMQPALGVSGVMGETASLNLILEGDPATRDRLDVHLNALGRCTKSLRAVGPAPARVRRARATAVNACGHLEAGAALVDIGIDAYQGGLGEGLLTRAAGSISKGVGLLGTASERLPPA
jgi:hypothetical protein